MQHGRMERLSQQLQQEIAMIIHQELKDPRLGFVTITRIELAKDVRHAKVRFSCLGGEEEREKSQQALDRAAYFIHGLLKKRFHLKTIPVLTFHYDASIEDSIRLSDTFNRIKDDDAGDA